MLPPLLRGYRTPRRKAITGYRLHRPCGQARVIVDSPDICLGSFGSPESRAKYHAIIREHQAERPCLELERTVGPVAEVTVNEDLIRYHQHVDSYDSTRDKPTSRILLVRLSHDVVHEKFVDREASRIGPVALKQCQDEFVQQELTSEECDRRVRQFIGRSKRS